MNEKIQAILLKIILSLKKAGWVPAKDWEITLKSEGHVPLIKKIKVQGSVEDEDWEDNVETYLSFKLDSRDKITYFPTCNVSTSISLVGLPTKDVINEMGIDVAFTDADVNNRRSIHNASVRTDDLVQEYIRQEYVSYVESNSQKIKLYNMGAIVDDDDDNVA